MPTTRKTPSKPPKAAARDHFPGHQVDGLTGDRVRPRVVMLRIELTEIPRREPMRFRDPSVTGSVCAVCGVHVNGGQPDFRFQRGPGMYLWRRCVDCSLLCLRLRLRALNDAHEQSRLMLEDITGRTLTDDDPTVREWIDTTAGRIAYGAHTVTQESGRGAAIRWEHVDVPELVADLARSLRYAAELRDGVPIPDGYSGCAGCGVTHAATWWKLRRIGTPARLVQYCDECTVTDDLAVRSLGGFCTHADRLAADAAGLDQVPAIEDGYAVVAGFRSFAETPGAVPSRRRWSYLPQSVRDQLAAAARY
jgi:hypothetical protein